MSKNKTKKESKREFSTILKKLNEIDKMKKVQSEMKKVQKEHGKKLEKLDEIENVQKEQGKTLNQLVERSVDHEDRLIRIEENMFTKEDGQKILNAIDSFAGSVSRLDDENVVGNEVMKRIGDDVVVQKKMVDRHEVEIQKLKKKVAVG